MDATGKQQTIATPIGAHGPDRRGRRVRLQLRPAPVGSGIRLVRRDLPGAPELPCDLRHARWHPERGLCIEHAQGAVDGLVPLLAACQGLGIDNLEIRLDGPSLPLLDEGSATPYVFLIHAAGRSEQSAPRPPLDPGEVLCFRHGDSRLSSGRSRGAYLGVVHGPRWALGMELSAEVFITQLARARPVGTRRWRDEPLRYALLEALAAMALVGGRFQGRLHWVGTDPGLHLAFWRHWEALREQEFGVIRQARG